MRYVVTELEGFAELRRYAGREKPGLSVQVVDTATCHRVVWQGRSEDHGSATGRAKDWLRYEGHRRACALNGEPPPEPFNRWRSHFRPTCPNCGTRCDPGAAYCTDCGKNLYRRENGH